MTPTTVMVDAALDAWWNGTISPDTDMRAALTAALAVSGYGEVVEALRSFPLPEQSGTSENNYRRILSWLYSRKPDVAALIIDLDCTALSRITGDQK